MSHNTTIFPVPGKFWSATWSWSCTCGMTGVSTHRDYAERETLNHRLAYTPKKQTEKRETVQVYYPKPEVQYEVWSKSSDMGQQGLHGSFDTFERADSEARAVRDRLKRTVRVVKVTSGN